MKTVTITMELTPEELMRLSSFLNNDQKKPSGVSEAMPKAEPVMTDAEAVEIENKKAEAKPEITKGKLRAISVKITKAGKSDELKEVFKKYGAAKLSELKEEDYAAVYADLEEING